jgi:hypothetical protein
MHCRLRNEIHLLKNTYIPFIGVFWYVCSVHVYLLIRPRCSSGRIHVSFTTVILGVFFTTVILASTKSWFCPTCVRMPSNMLWHWELWIPWRACLLQQISTLAGNLTPSLYLWEVLFTMGIGAQHAKFSTSSWSQVRRKDCKFRYIIKL